MGFIYFQIFNPFHLFKILVPIYGYSIKNLLVYERKYLSDQNGNNLPKGLEEQIIRSYNKGEYKVISN